MGDKNSPYVETDAAEPLNAYGITKLAGEHFTAAAAEKHSNFWLPIYRPVMVAGSLPYQFFSSVELLG